MTKLLKWIGGILGLYVVFVVIFESVSGVGLRSSTCQKRDELGSGLPPVVYFLPEDSCPGSR